MRFSSGSSRRACDLSAEELAKECRWQAFRGSGPGGQKRNKTSSAVRVTHIPSGISAIASESRSQLRNKQKAMSRLRRRLAFELRSALDDRLSTQPPAPPLGPEFPDIAVSDEQYPPLIAYLLDQLLARKGSVSETAASLKISTARLVRLLQRDEELLDHANRIRRSAGLRPLGAANRSNRKGRGDGHESGIGRGAG